MTRVNANLQELNVQLDNGHLDAAFDDPGADGVAGEAGSVVDIEFFHEVAPMFFHGLDADAQIGRRLLVGLALGDKLQYLHFA